MATIIFRNGLNQESFELDSKKKNGEIFLVRTDYINGFKEESIFTEHPHFETKKEANAWIKNHSEESYRKDKEFTDSYMQ